jgi:hypothetical protein
LGSRIIEDYGHQVRKNWRKKTPTNHAENHDKMVVEAGDGDPDPNCV